MKKKILIPMIILACFIFTISYTYAEYGDLKIKYRPNNMTTNQTGFYMQIENNSGTTVNLEDLKIFYYFTLDNELTPQLSSGLTYSGYLELIYHRNLFPQPNAIDMLEFNFGSGAGTLSNGQTSEEIQIWITDGVSDNNNDYSYDGNISSTGANQYNENIKILLDNEVVWGSNLGAGDQNVIVNGGWFENIPYMPVNTANIKVRNDDAKRIEFCNAFEGSNIIFFFKDISASSHFSSVEKITVKIKHFEDIHIFDADDLKLTIGKGLKPGETPEVWDTTYMPPIHYQAQEDYFYWDITGSISSEAQFNEMELKMEFNTPTTGTARFNHVAVEMDYIWNGKYAANPVVIGTSRGGVDLSYGHTWISLPQATGILEIVSHRGLDITVENFGNPIETFPAVKPYYIVKYKVNSTIAKIIRHGGERALILKYTN